MSHQCASIHFWNYIFKTITIYAYFLQFLWRDSVWTIHDDEPSSGRVWNEDLRRAIHHSTFAIGESRKRGIEGEST